MIFGIGIGDILAEYWIAEGLICGVFIVDDFEDVRVVERDALLELADEVQLLLLWGVYALVLLDDVLGVNIFEEFVIEASP